MSSWKKPAFLYNGTTFIPTYSAKAKVPIDMQKATRHDSITTSGKQQSVTERLDRLNTLDFPYIPESDLSNWDAFLSWALLGRQFQYAPDSTLCSLTFTAAANASAGSTVYTGTIPGGASNGQAGLPISIAGFSNPANNGVFMCTASTATTVTVSNPAGVAESHAATGFAAWYYFFMGMDGVPKWVAFELYQFTMQVRRVVAAQMGL